uniref:Uncharacterized protein n=1 Tax=virus sp. ctmTa7 TaxID=2828255 RepID=A0A8S5RCN8_9VIRU|nr:MAG TPA: hypothetical protein [virus sp. ctmTa7]
MFKLINIIFILIQIERRKDCVKRNVDCRYAEQL